MIFVDTGAWIALLDQRDRFHENALRFQREIGQGKHGRMVTTDHVLGETVSYLRLHGRGPLVGEFRRILMESESLQILWTPAERFWEAWRRMEDRADKRWSFTDCLSFITMESMGISTAFGFDSDFRQAGFELLPSAPT